MAEWSSVWLVLIAHDSPFYKQRGLHPYSGHAQVSDDAHMAKHRWPRGHH